MTDARSRTSHHDPRALRRRAMPLVLAALGKEFARAWTFAALALAACAFGCGNDAQDRPACLSGLDVDTCVLAYPPEYKILFERVFAQSCTSAGTSCHGSSGGQGGLSFLDVAESHSQLLAPRSGGARVKPGDAACSELVVRLDSVGNSWSMPPATPLDERQRCSIRRWIQAGAKLDP